MWVVRAGVAGGALTTLMATGAAAPTSLADADKSAETTAQLPVVPLSAELQTHAAQTAEVTEQAAFRYELAAEQEAAQAKAVDAAQEAKESAEKKRAAELKKEREEAQARADRSSERSTLSASAPASNATGNTAELISFLKAQLGKAYVLGGTGPSSYDCSGLTQAAFRSIGVTLPRTSQDQSTVGTAIPVSQVQVGDLVFWGGVGSAHHVAVYIGDGKYLDAANPSKGVVIQEMSYYMPTSAVRVL